MDPGVRSHGMKANPPGYLWSKYECFLMSGWWDILHSSCFNVKLWSNSTNGTKLRTDKWMDEQKDENYMYIPLGINARGIKRRKLYTLSITAGGIIICHFVKGKNKDSTPHFNNEDGQAVHHLIVKIDWTSVKLMSHLRKLTKLTKWKSDKN